MTVFIYVNTSKQVGDVDHLKRLPDIAAELVRLKVDVIVTGTTYMSQPSGTRPRRYPL